MEMWLRLTTNPASFLCRLQLTGGVGTRESQRMGAVGA